MNLTVRSAIHRIEARAGKLESGLGAFSDAMERAELRDALAQVRSNLSNIETVLDELNTAQESLRENGFNDQWFDIWNAQGDFLETINVDLMDLLGSDQEKAEVCMEGLGETIWNWIKKAFQWIIEMFNKIVSWIKNVLLVWNRDIDLQKKLYLFLEGLRGVNMTEICNEIDDNKVIANDRGVIDIRELVNRIQIENMILNRIVYMHEVIYGFDMQASATDPSRLFNKEFVDYVTGNPEDKLANPELRAIVKDISVFDSKFDSIKEVEMIGGKPSIKDVATPPLKLFMPGQFSTTEFAPASRSNIKEQVQRCGIKITNSGTQINLELSDPDRDVGRIKYASTYFQLADIQSVCKECIDIHDKINKCVPNHTSGIGKYKKEIMDAMLAANRAQNQLKELNLRHKKDADFTNQTYQQTLLNKVYSHYAKWVSETVSMMSRMSMDIARCRSIIRSVSANVGQVIVKHVGDKK